MILKDQSADKGLPWPIYAFLVQVIADMKRVQSVGSEDENDAPDRRVELSPLTVRLYGHQPLCAAQWDRTQGRKMPLARNGWHRTSFLVRNNDSRVTRLQAVTISVSDYYGKDFTPFDLICSMPVPTALPHEQSWNELWNLHTCGASQLARQTRSKHHASLPNTNQGRMDWKSDAGSLQRCKRPSRSP
jgi:hypothetical protein